MTRPKFRDMVSFTDSAEAEALAERAHELMEEVVLPKERELESGMSVSENTIDELRATAREYGVYAPHIDEEYGGMGHDFRDVLPTFEEAGRSILGQLAMHIAAPNEGNMHLLELHGSELQKEEYLKPLVAGDISSGFSMTEPIQGGGSDPKMLKTTAEKDGDEWVIDGHKWWTTNGLGAEFLLVFARTDQDVHPYEGCSVFIVPAEADGVEIVRSIPHIGPNIENHGHAEIKYNQVRVPEEHLLGEEGEGFTHVQERLGPARLTHCMRYSGMAERSLEIAKAYMSEREAFGAPVADKQAPRHAIAEHEMKLAAARALVRQAADQISAGEEARIPVSMAKVFTSNVTQDAIDSALQYCGANGIAKDLPISDFYESVRQFRLVDGADEVHLRTIARDSFADVHTEELEPITRYEK
jgi:acyl-CoA dehydrogenase